MTDEKKTFTKEEVQRIVAQQMNRGIALPPSDGTGEYTKMKDEIISLFFLAQQGILTPEEILKAINKMKREKGFSEIASEVWAKRFSRGESK